MPKVATLWTEIGAKTRGFDTALDRSLKKMERFGNRMTSVGKSLSTRLTLPLTFVGVGMIKAASDAEEMQSKFEAVFKNLTPVTEEWAKITGDAVGRSDTELKGYLATLQDTFVPLGFARDRAADMSKTLVKLAIDLGSFNNVADDEVIRDLQSALVGNVETLRKYGVVANETAIKQEALNSGLWSGKGALDAQTKAQAILNITLAGTTDAQGDAIRTADSFAGRMKKLKSSTTKLSEEIGKRLIVKISPLVEKLNNAADAAKNADGSFFDMGVNAGITAGIVGPLTVALGWFIKHPVALALTGMAAGFAAIETQTSKLLNSGKLDTLAEKLAAIVQPGGLVRELIKRASADDFVPDPDIGGVSFNNPPASDFFALQNRTKNRKEIAETRAGVAAPFLTSVGAINPRSFDRTPLSAVLNNKRVASANDPLREKIFELADSTGRLQKATSGATFEMRQVAPVTLKLKEAGLATASAFEQITSGAFKDLAFGAGNAAAELLIFGGNLRDTFTNLGKRAVGGFIGSVLNFGVGALLKSTPIGAAVSVAGAATGAVGKGGGVSASVSLSEFTVRQNRASRNAGHNLISTS